jgi:periplasmic protein CpxP/Spy
VVEYAQNGATLFEEKTMKMIVAVLASTLAVGVALAQAPSQQASSNSSMNASGSSMANSDAKRDSAVEKHIADMHRKLKITAAQESQWTQVADTMRGNAKDLDRAIDQRDANRGSATAIDDLNAYAAIVQAHADGVKKLASAFSALYSAMSADQRAAADEAFNEHGHTARKMAKQ